MLIYNHAHVLCSMYYNTVRLSILVYNYMILPGVHTNECVFILCTPDITCNSYNTCSGDVSHLYHRARGHIAPEGVVIQMRYVTTIRVINCFVLY